MTIYLSEKIVYQFITKDFERVNPARFLAYALTSEVVVLIVRKKFADNIQ